MIEPDRMTNRARARVLNVLKFLFAALLIAWMLTTGKLDLTRVASARSHWPDLCALIALMLLQIVITAWRWRLLLTTQGVTLGLKEVFRLTMIGSLFNLMIPSSVGGDVMKAYYASRGRHERKGAIVATILVDRVAGLLGLFALAAAAALASFSMLRVNGVLMALGLTAVSGFLGGAGFLLLAVCYGPRIWRARLAGFSAYRARPRVLPTAVAVSAFCHLLGCLEFALALRALGSPGIGARVLLLLAPFGFLATAVPLSPAGIGVGQAAFFALFGILNSGALGANAFTVYQTMLLAVCCGGFYYYLKRPPNEKEWRVESAAN